MKNKREISLEEYFLKNKSQYKGSSILETIKEIIKNYKKDLKIKKSAKAVIIINKIEDIFKNLDFNWINKIENKEATYVNEGNVINDLVVFYKKNKQLFDNYSQDKKENIQKILNEWEYFKDKVLFNTSCFVDKNLGTIELLYIKKSDLEEYTKDYLNFSTKIFKDTKHHICLNFICKKTDKDFTIENIRNKLLNYK